MHYTDFAEAMGELKDKDHRSSGSDDSVVIGVVLVIFMVVMMAVSTIYPFPDGKSLGVGDFIMLWFREILIIGLFLVIGVAWLIQLIRKRMSRNT